MVVLDLNMVKTYGLGSRQASYVGAGDSWSTTEEMDASEIEERKQNQVLRKATHLYLQSRNIHKISPQINKLANLKVIYLYDNKLTSIAALAHAASLTHVYLQGNNIESTAGLSKLKNLEKLYLSGNKIEVVEDLCCRDGNGSLQELHIENQQLPSGMPLVFEPEALDSLRFTIKIINISGNNVQTVDNILRSCHKTLEKLDASNNLIKSVNIEQQEQLLRFPRLQQIILKKNPLQTKSATKKYRQSMVTKFEALTYLDGNEISSFERKWHLAFHEKEQNKLQMAQARMLREASSEKIEQSTMVQDLIPPVPDHWRARGLPGARHQFDQILAKARAKASSSQQLNNEIAGGEQVMHKKMHDIDLGVGDEQQQQQQHPFGLGIKNLDSEGDLRNQSKNRSQVRLAPMKLAPLDD